jgi:hypothetical protein
MMVWALVPMAKSMANAMNRVNFFIGTNFLGELTVQRSNRITNYAMGIGQKCLFFDQGLGARKWFRKPRAIASLI